MRWRAAAAAALLLAAPRADAVRPSKQWVEQLLESNDFASNEVAVGTTMWPFNSWPFTELSAWWSSLWASLASDPAGLPPKHAGTVGEQTIWTYWYDPHSCPTADKCTLPPHLELCAESIEKNRGDFQFVIVHHNEVFDYVSRSELPQKWMDMESMHQKDSLMNALLARYGGVAIDLSTVLLRPLDIYWNEMEKANATFRGYLYRSNGQKWGPTESMAVWFLMSRREGIFATAVRNQVSGMGSSKVPVKYPEPYRALGDQTLTPIIAMYNSSWPKCSDDPWVPEEKKYQCPERSNVSGPIKFANGSHPHGDVKLMLQEPRDGPQMPFCFEDDLGMGTWDVDDDTEVHCDECKTRRECWEFFWRRFSQSERMRKDKEGSPPLLFVKLFHAGGKKLRSMTREELLKNKNTYFYHWLAIAGVVDYE